MSSAKLKIASRFGSDIIILLTHSWGVVSSCLGTQKPSKTDHPAYSNHPIIHVMLSTYTYTNMFHDNIRAF